MIFFQTSKNHDFWQYSPKWPNTCKIGENENFWNLNKIKLRHWIMTFWGFRSIFRTWRTHFKTYFIFSATSGQIWYHVRIHKIWRKSRFLAQNTIFFKVADIVRKIDIWPENDILCVLEWFGSLIWYLESSRTNFEKIEKNRIFWIFDLWVTTISVPKFRPIGRNPAE